MLFAFAYWRVSHFPFLTGGGGGGARLCG